MCFFDYLYYILFSANVNKIYVANNGTQAKTVGINPTVKMLFQILLRSDSYRLLCNKFADKQHVEHINVAVAVCFYLI